MERERLREEIGEREDRERKRWGQRKDRVREGERERWKEWMPDGRREGERA